ncbi:MAG: NAD+ synthase [Fusobacteria bacterium]|nr:NAD+ synthase [Fusobacteriota bacterium]
MMKEYIAIIEKYIKAYVEKAGAKGVVVGLSGGIDSAVVAALAARALGKDYVLGIIMPCESVDSDLEDAIKLAEKTGISYKVVDLTKTYKSFLEDNQVEADNTCLTYGNIKPRLRMTTLYFYSALYNYLVAGTSNRSELITGYLTKYGDGGVDFEPIADLLKKDVYQIARELDLPKSIIEKKPSAGLIVNQDDETELGFTYDELDSYIESGLGDKAVVKKILKLYNASRHKLKIPDQLNLNRNFYIR